jgi:Zn-dependent protease with chaperone function
MKDSRILGRAVIALSLLVGFYTLALGIAIALLWVPYAEFVYAHHITPKLAVLCIVGGAAILWSVLPRPDKFEPPGVRLQPEQHPRLFKALDRVAKATHQAIPAEVYVVPEVNAWVMQRGGLMGFGSRKVMGMGLPLMRILTCDQFSAVLAHEFGHFYGGDTRIGPWIYKTRAAIGRTLSSLGHRAWLQAPFRWYGKLFLRVTHAVSRRQEFVADELAARTVGARPLVDGLRSAHRVGPAFEYYWQGECTPVLTAGFLPPLADGFDQFMKARHIADRMDESLAAELASGKADPYDSHPPLKDRIAAVAGLPEGPSTLEGDLPAISLLEDLPGLERELIAKIAGPDQAGKLTSIPWGEVGSRVYVPRWARLAERNAASLEAVTPESLSEIMADLKNFGKRLVDSSGDPPDIEKSESFAKVVVGAALTLLLIDRGGQLDVLPGSEISVKLRSHDLRPFSVIPSLQNGSITKDVWTTLCAELGIAGTKVSLALHSGKSKARHAVDLH